MKNFLSAFKFVLPALLLVATFFLFATDSGHYALFPAAPDATTIVHAETTGGHFAPPANHDAVACKTQTSAR